MKTTAVKKNRWVKKNNATTTTKKRNIVSKKSATQEIELSLAMHQANVK